MCGIAGFAVTQKNAFADANLRRMTDALAHRGPDADGYFTDDKIALGHRRLSIIDLSQSANQPLTDESKRFTIVFNGEIYNFARLRASLKNHQFRTDSDTEVLLAAYIERGADCLNDLDGMFAFAVWDAREQTLFVARDRIGKKPLYYFHDNDQFIFASEIRALLKSSLVAPVLNQQALSEYLQFYSLAAPLTLIKGVQTLKPGCYGIFKDAKFVQKKYWSLTDHNRESFKDDYAATKARVLKLLQAAVEKRLIADVPLGAFLSGGIDSSAIVALMATVSDSPINTFSITFEESKYDESAYSSLIAQKYNTKHYAARLTGSDFLGALPDALAAMDFPTVDGVNTFVVAAAARRAGCSVALSGVGGDELFAGYPVFYQYQKIQHAAVYYRLPQTLKNIVGNLVGSFRKDNKSERRQQLAALASSNFEDLYPVFRRNFNKREISALLNSTVLNVNPLERLFTRRELSFIHSSPKLSQVSIGELSTYTLNLLLRDADQMSMCHGLEIRAPFLDYKLIEYVLSVPDAFKQSSSSKRLLVDALGKLLPEEIVKRPKMGFSFPWNEWMRGELKDFCCDKINHLKRINVFNSAMLEDVWHKFIHNSPQITWAKVWQLVVLSDWLERHSVDA